jgi:LysM repeat protein
MNSVRPLVTIAILVVVGAFLYVKINEGPARHAAGPSDAWTNQPPEGVPPLGVAGSATQPHDAHAPAWSLEPPATLAAEPAPPSPAADATSTVQTPSVPAVPAVPAIPGAEPAQLLPVDSLASAGTPPVGLPANIPSAQYPDEQAAPAAQPLGAAAANNVSSPPALTANAVETAASPSPAKIASAQPPTRPLSPGVEPFAPITPLGTESNSLASNESSPPAASAAQMPPEVAVPADSDRYAMNGTPAASASLAGSPPPTQQSFATNWPEIQAALTRGDLATAHRQLSKWHADPTLTPTDTELVDNLLSQLAGTVVYSTEHQLEPAYTVKPGDTLESVAGQYNVPAQLLDKINGIAPGEPLRPGQELKVLRGPFSAVVDLDRKYITLTLDGCYAGQFPIEAPISSELPTGEWVVDKKLTGTAELAIVLRSATASGGAANTLAIACGNVSARSAAAGTPVIQISPQDGEDLIDILSIGSSVVVRR